MSTTPEAFLGCLQRRQGVLHMENLALPELAQRYGTPLYVYSKAELTRALREFSDAFRQRSHLICYAVKANSNLAILRLFARLGAGFDIVSGGELARVLAAGGDPAKVVFSGVGKSAAEIRQALAAGVLCFNVESASELQRINRLAGELGKRAPVSLRVNPDVDAQTHPYISTGLKANKFGIAHEQALTLYGEASRLSHIEVVGIDCHIGSQITNSAPFADALARLVEMVSTLERQGIKLHHIDIGGGIGIRYRDETPLTPAQYAAALLPALAGLPHQLLFEPGRFLVGNAGVLVTRIEYLKHGEKNFAIVDAAMNDLIRPALYKAYHEIAPVLSRDEPARRYDVVGPICETGDFLGHERDLAIREDDLLAVLCAGAYGASESSNYNTRGRAAEVLVDGDRAYLIAQRESIDELLKRELLPDF